MKNFILILSTLLISTTAFSQDTTVINYGPGTYSWTVPCDVLDLTVEVWGGGGAGGGSTSNNEGGGGGGGGGYAMYDFGGAPPAQGTLYNLLVGSGGVASTGDGTAGGQSTFSTPTFGQPFWNFQGLRATGGQFGTGGTNGGGAGTGGAGGTILGTPAPNGASAPGQAGFNGVDGDITPPGIGGNGGNMGIGAGAGAGLIDADGSGGTEGGGGGGGEMLNPGAENGGPGGPGGIRLTIITNGSVADAGEPQATCNDPWTMNATPVNTGNGYTGTWTVTLGTAGFIGSINDPNVQVTGIPQGTCATIRWTVSKLGCLDTYDEVVICHPNICNDDPCGATPLTVDGACLVGEVIDGTFTPSIGMPDPICGGFDPLYGPAPVDTWYSAVVPANGILNFTVDGVTSDYMEAALYSGPCTNLTLESCNALLPAAAGGINNIQGTFTPGETIYIRIWEFLNSPANFDICAISQTNSSQIVPGQQTITCGETFYDPGGALGNYGNNQNVVYTICPPDGSFASVTFTNLNLSGGDRIIVLDGAGSSAPIIGNLTSTSTAPPNLTITASGNAADSCLTFIFMSNSSGTNLGWTATANCSPTAGTNTISCGPEDCLGGCIPTVCAIPGFASFIGSGVGVNELNESNNGCFRDGWEGEQCSNWFIINPITPGTLTLHIYVNPGQDHDFSVYEGFSPYLDCPSMTSNEPIRCNSVSGGSAVGTGFDSAETDPRYEPTITVTPADIAAGIYYLVYLKNYSAGCSNPVVDLTFGGTAGLTCSPPDILPIELINFDGSTEGRYNTLYWATLTEVNNDYFTVEGSTDGLNWEVIGNVDGAENSTLANFYELEDRVLSRQVTYYRLKQTDFNGQFKYSETIILTRDLDFTSVFSSVFPNPSNNTFNFVYGGVDYNTPISIEVYNSLGQLVKSKGYDVFNNSTALSIDCGTLSKGIYNVVLSQGDKSEQQKISLIK